MTMRPGPAEQNPRQHTPGVMPGGSFPPTGFPPGTFPPGTFPPGSVPSWPVRYPPLPPGRPALIFARVMLGIQAAFWTLFLSVASLAFFQQSPPPGVTSPYGDPQPSLTRDIIILLVTVAIVASTVTATVRLAPSRRRMWWLALAAQAALAALYGWLFTWMAVAPSPEGMASFAAVTVGPVAVAIPVTGLVALLLPSARAAALHRP
jgi:hypothetical protein